MKKCALCGGKMQAVDSRGAGPIVKGIAVLTRRRFECNDCHERVTTYEIAEAEFNRLVAAVEVVYRTIPDLLGKIKTLQENKNG